MAISKSGEYFMFVASAASKDGGGIYVYRINIESGSLRLLWNDPSGRNSSFLALDPQRRFLYSVGDAAGEDGARAGFVNSFGIDIQSGRLSFINRESTLGTGSCFVSTDNTGRYVLAANYSDGTLAVLPVDETGALGKVSCHIRHSGSSVDPKRQSEPHAHSILPDPENRFVLSADLGLDKIMIYKWDPDTGELAPNDTPWAQVEGGAGPRHMAFNPNGRFVYVINELNSTISAFTYDGAGGVMNPFQTVDTLPGGFGGTNYPADIHVSPSGLYLFGSNRGHDSIVIYKIDAAGGKLSYTDHESTQGGNPVNFAVDPSGCFLLAANRDSGTIVVFRIDPKTGNLEPKGDSITIPAPVCVKLMPVES